MSALFIATAFLIILAAFFGGGGGNYPMGEMAVELAAMPALLLSLWRREDGSDLSAFRWPILIFLGLFGLVILQIIPLSPSLWQALPGREPFTGVAQLAGQADSWRSWSLDPQQTLRSGLSLIVPFAILLAVMRFNHNQIAALFGIAISMAAANLLVGIMQVSSGGQSYYAYKSAHMGLPLGFFANRNHVALFFLLALVFSSALFTAPKILGIRDQAQIRLSTTVIFGMMAAAIAFSFGILATNSRTVIALLVPTVLVLIYLAVPAKHSKFAALSALGGTAILGGAFAWLAQSGKSALVNRLIERFSQSEDHRFEFWPDSITALFAYFPFGSGIGTFDIAFRPHESLDIVGSHFVNSAHNDYIEIGIETGAFGMLLLFAFLLWAGRAAFAIIRSRTTGPEHWLALHSVFALVLLGLHSLTDYPARRITIMALCGLLIAAIAAFGRRGRAQADLDKPL